MGVIVSTAAITGTGSATITTPPIDTTGATAIYIAAAGVFNVGIPSNGLDNQGNTYTLVANPSASNNSGMGFWHLDNPVTSTAHKFQITNDQHDFIDLIVIAAKATIPTGTNSFVAAIAGDNQNPVKSNVSISGPVPIVPSAPQWFFVTAGLGGVGWSGVPTIDEGFTLVSAQTRLAMAYLVAPNTSAINPTWATLLTRTDVPNPKGAVVVYSNSTFVDVGGNWFVYES